ncbi:MAG: hypothetical protein WCH39_27015, partial [Schlesneria sp.]
RKPNLMSILKGAENGVKRFGRLRRLIPEISVPFGPNGCNTPFRFTRVIDGIRRNPSRIREKKVKKRLLTLLIPSLQGFMY